MKTAGLLLILALVACAHGSDVSVTVVRTGSIYPPLAEGCPVQFVNAQHLDILTSGQFDQLGMIAFAGKSSELERAISQLPGAVAAAACKMGGNAVSIANMLGTSSGTGLLQFSVWRSRGGATPAAPAEPAANSI